MRRKQFRLIPILVCLAAIAALVAGCDDDNDATSATPTDSAPEVSLEPVAKPTFTGPNGEEPTPGKDVTLSDAEVEQLRQGDYTVAFAWAAVDPSTVANEQGARDRFREMGIRVVGKTDSDFDPAKQTNDYQTLLARKPDALVTLLADPDSAAAALRKYVDEGVKIVFMENVPTGFKQGTDYVSLVSADYTTAAAKAADIIAAKMGGEGDLGFIYYDANFFVVNQWDKAFQETIKEKYPNIKIAAKAGFADPRKVEEVANGMITRNPNLKAIYASWQEPAEGVLTALRGAGREQDIALTTVGLSEPVSLSVATDGAVAGVGGMSSYEEGRLFAEMVGYGLLNKTAPPLVVSPAFGVMRENLAEAYKLAYDTEAPESVREALGQ